RNRPHRTSRRRTRPRAAACASAKTAASPSAQRVQPMNRQGSTCVSPKKERLPASRRRSFHCRAPTIALPARQSQRPVAASINERNERDGFTAVAVIVREDRAQMLFFHPNPAQDG